MLKVFCIIIGGGNPFLVKIAPDDAVAELKNKIKEMEGFTFPAEDLELYLAVKDGDWLNSRDEDLRTLSESTEPNVVTAFYTADDKKIDPTEAVSKYFSQQGQPPFNNDNSIHVVVVAPPEEEFEDDATEMPRVEQKRKTYYHSELTEDEGKLLLRELGCYVEYLESDTVNCEKYECQVVRDENGDVVPMHELVQKNVYCDFLEANIGNLLNEQHLCIFHVEGHENLFSADVPGLGIELRGSTGAGNDLLILSSRVKKFPHQLPLLPSARMLICMERSPINQCTVYPTLSKLIALDVRANDPVVALLTNFENYWAFYWVGEMQDSKNIIQAMTLDDPAVALQVIRSVLSQPGQFGDEIWSLRLPFVERPLKRCKFNPVLDDDSYEVEGGSVRECLQQYFDISSVTGPDEDLAREVARRLVKTVPCWRMDS